MPDRQSPAGGVTAHITIGEGKAADAIAFYEKAFGAQELMRHAAPDGRLMHAHLSINGGSLMLNDHFAEMNDGKPAQAPVGTTLHLHVDDADAWWDRALAAGASVRFPLENQFWGDRYGQLTDPFGHVWSIGGPVKGQ
ncbi:VOC family protein [Sphingobium aquiterrae]|uniref:VOC family protein n=1 Tax=Sphingobium aquiterrae TaxID=2038656 RepID=UPI003017339F